MSSTITHTFALSLLYPQLNSVSLFYSYNCLIVVYRPPNPFLSTELPWSSARPAIFPFAYLQYSKRRSSASGHFWPAGLPSLKEKESTFGSINHLPPRHSQWRYLKLDSFIQEWQAMRMMVIFPGVGLSLASLTLALGPQSIILSGRLWNLRWHWMANYFTPPKNSAG